MRKCPKTRYFLGVKSFLTRNNTNILRKLSNSCGLSGIFRWVTCFSITWFRPVTVFGSEDMNVSVCSDFRSSEDSPAFRLRFARASCSSSTRGNVRRRSCCRLRSEVTWPGKSGSARGTLWWSCRLTPGGCWPGKLCRRSDET